MKHDPLRIDMVCLKKHNFPRDGFQLLCFNCHLAKTYWGACPHEAARAAATA